MCCAWQSRPFCAWPRVALGGRGGGVKWGVGHGGCWVGKVERVTYVGARVRCFVGCASFFSSVKYRVKRNGIANAWPD